jgi:hypothetical protein
LDGVDIRVSEQEGEDGVSGPSGFVARENNQGNEENQGPDLRVSTDFQSVVALDSFTNPRRKEELKLERSRRKGIYLKHHEDETWDREQVGVQSAEAERAEDESEIGGRRGKRDSPSQSDNIQNPHIIIRQATPHLPDRDGLSIMHVSL